MMVRPRIFSCYLSIYLLIWLLTYLPTYLPTYLLNYLLIYLLTYLIYLLSYLLTYFLDYLLTQLLTYLLTSFHLIDTSYILVISKKKTVYFNVATKTLRRRCMLYVLWVSHIYTRINKVEALAIEINTRSPCVV